MLIKWKNYLWLTSDVAEMSFRDDRFLWKDAARRILNLQHSSSAGTLNTNLNVILDELNSLDYATSVVENEEVRALKMELVFNVILTEATQVFFFVIFHM